MQRLRDWWLEVQIWWLAKRIVTFGRFIPARDIATSRVLWDRFGRLIMSRSPAQVQRMERARGLLPRGSGPGLPHHRSRSWNR
jgi:hypothetical protein